MEREIFQLIYKNDKNKNRLRIIGKSFYNYFKKNRIKGYFLYKKRKFILKDIINKKNIKNNEIKIDIIFNEKIDNKSCMFKNCTELKEFHQVDKSEFYKYSEITNISLEETEENLLDLYNEEEVNSSLNKKFYYQSFISDSSIQEKLDSSILDASFILKQNFNTNIPKKYAKLSGMFQNCTSLTNTVLLQIFFTNQNFFYKYDSLFYFIFLKILNKRWVKEILNKVYLVYLIGIQVM